MYNYIPEMKKVIAFVLAEISADNMEVKFIFCYYYYSISNPYPQHTC